MVCHLSASRFPNYCDSAALVVSEAETQRDRARASSRLPVKSIAAIGSGTAVVSAAARLTMVPARVHSDGSHRLRGLNNRKQTDQIRPTTRTDLYVQCRPIHEIKARALASQEVLRR